MDKNLIKLVGLTLKLSNPIKLDSDDYLKIYIYIYIYKNTFIKKKSQVLLGNQPSLSDFYHFQSFTSSKSVQPPS